MSTAVARSGFQWRTMKGEVLTLAQMETSHVFNAMKMCFNHLAEAWGGEPVWFVKRYDGYARASLRKPEQLAWLVVFFIAEIQRRGDLPAHYQAPYLRILEQLLPRLLPQERQQIEGGGRLLV